MYIRSRNESIEQLSETLNPEQLRKAITQIKALVNAVKKIVNVFFIFPARIFHRNK